MHAREFLEVTLIQIYHQPHISPLLEKDRRNTPSEIIPQVFMQEKNFVAFLQKTKNNPAKPEKQAHSQVIIIDFTTDQRIEP